MPLKLGPDLRVLLVDANGAALSVGGGTQYADGVTQANPTGNVVLWLDTANVIRAASATKPLPVAIISGAGGSQTDASAWTTAVTSFSPGGGVFNDSAADLTAGQQGTLRMTAKRAQHMNLRNSSAAEIGIAAAPLVVGGAKTNNNAAPGATNVGVLGSLATALAQSWTEGNLVNHSVDLSGFQRGIVHGIVAGGASATGVNPVSVGFVGTGATVRNWTAANSVTATAGNDVPGMGPLVYDTVNVLWNRQRDTNSADNSSGTGISGAGVLGWDGSVYRRLGVDASGSTKAIGTKTHNAAVPATNVSTMPAVANAALPSWTETFDVKQSVDLHGQQRVVAAGLTTIISATITRPNDTTAYAAGDEMTDTGGTIRTLTGAARYTGGSGIIQGVYVSQSTLWTTKPVMEIWVYDTTSTPVADNGAFAPTDGVTDTAIAIIPVTTSYAGTVNQGLDSGPVSFPFLTAGSANLFFRVVIRNAAQDSAVSGTSLFRWRILQD